MGSGGWSERVVGAGGGVGLFVGAGGQVGGRSGRANGRRPSGPERARASEGPLGPRPFGLLKFGQLRFG